MNDDSARLQMAQWVLERNLHWIAAAEVKTGVIVALDTAMLGALAAAFSALEPSGHSVWVKIITTVPAVCLGVAIICAAMSVVPRVTGPAMSFIFFGKVAQRNVVDYVEAFRKATEAELLDDCLAQIHRNAQIACDKFDWVRASMLWSFAAVLPWTLALGFLIGVRDSA